jgi:hypothetical protein
MWDQPDQVRHRHPHTNRRQGTIARKDKMATRRKNLDRMTHPQLLQEAKRLQFTVTSRGCRIGALYNTIKHLMEDHPDRVQVIHPTDETNTLRAQLTQARAQLVEAMKARSGAEGAAGAGGGGGALEKADCIVCFEKFGGTRVPVALNCGHIYCEECILKAQTLNEMPKCPLCRKVFTGFIPLFF